MSFILPSGTWKVNGGNAGRNSKNYRVSIPSAWINELGLNENNRDLVLQFDGESISIRKPLSNNYTAFRNTAIKMKHKTVTLFFYNRQTLCSKICADYSAKEVRVENLTDDIWHRAFGVNLLPSWNDYEEFLKSRCIPKERDGIKFYLKELGLYEYDALEIIKKTNGRIAEDEGWLALTEDC